MQSKYVPPAMKNSMKNPMTNPMMNKSTMASFTTSKGKSIVMTENDFPVLGKKPSTGNAVPSTGKAVPSTGKAVASYAGLARDWAKKKQEEEEIKKMSDSAVIQTALAYDDRIVRELSAKMKQVRLQQIQPNSLEEDESYIPPPVDDYEEYAYSAQIEEEEEEEYDPTINYRRNKNELSTF